VSYIHNTDTGLTSPSREHESSGLPLRLISLTRWPGGVGRPVTSPDFQIPIIRLHTKSMQNSSLWAPVVKQQENLLASSFQNFGSAHTYVRQSFDPYRRIAPLYCGPVLQVCVFWKKYVLPTPVPPRLSILRHHHQMISSRQAAARARQGSGDEFSRGGRKRRKGRGGGGCPLKKNWSKDNTTSAYRRYTATYCFVYMHVCMCVCKLVSDAR
jgi:hypothetical protein